MYPNPAQSEMVIEGAKGYEVNLYNMSGQEVYIATIIKDKDGVNITRLAAGVYVVQVRDALGVRMMRRIIKEWPT